MRLYLQPKLLFDAAFSGREEEEGYYIFETQKVEELKNELLHGNPSCFLVSGYRGVGKSSFLKKVEKEVTSSGQNDQTVFVYTSFAYYSNQTHLLRKLIRELYLSLSDSGAYRSARGSTPAERQKMEELKVKIETLYQRTFHDISNSQLQKIAAESKTEVSAEVKPMEVLKVIGKSLPPLATLGFGAGLGFNWFPNPWVGLGLFALSAIGTALGYFNVKWSGTHTRSNVRQIQLKTLYDDEIAGYYLMQVLRELQETGFRVIFVLDELDKVEEAEIDQLLKEMKPFLVSGYASFIVVAGQNLYYKYYREQYEEDSVLSSLFSKTIHINLHFPQKLANLFNRLMEEGQDYPQEPVDQALAYYVFKSHLVPRRFINLIRQDSDFEEDRCYLEIPEGGYDFDYQSINNQVDRLREDIINDHRSECIQDHFFQSLYIRVENELPNPEKTNPFNQLRKTVR